MAKMSDQAKQTRALLTSVTKAIRARLATAGEVQMPPELTAGTRPNRVFHKQCFDRAYQYMSNHDTVDGMALVHGHYHPGDSPFSRPTSHAWVEIPLEGRVVVFDGVAQRFYDREGYYRVQRAVAEKSYTFKEAMRLLFEERHYGPWHPTNEEKWLADILALAQAQHEPNDQD